MLPLHAGGPRSSDAARRAAAARPWVGCQGSRRPRSDAALHWSAWTAWAAVRSAERLGVPAASAAAAGSRAESQSKSRWRRTGVSGPSEGHFFPVAWAERHWVNAAVAPGIAAQHSSRRQDSASGSAMKLQGLDRVGAAARLKTAMGADERPQRPLINPDAEDQQARRQDTPALLNARRRSSISIVNGRDRVASRPISTRSMP